MSKVPSCPQCKSDFCYADGTIYICPECAYEWPEDSPESENSAEQKPVVRDAVGNKLSDGDSVIVVKDLKVKGSSLVVKVGTKVKNIRLIEEIMISTAKLMALVPCS